MSNVLIIRPPREAESLANSLKLKNIKSTLHPLFKPHFLPLPPLNTSQAFIVTSQNAVYALEGHETLKDIPVYGVGEQTASVAKRLGFRTVICGAGTSQDLAHFVLSNAHPERGPLVHLSGEKVTGRIVETLRENGFEAHRKIIYKIVDLSNLPDPLIKDLINKTLTHVMFFSSRTTDVFVNLIKKHGLEETVLHMTSLCLSKNVAEQAMELTWKNVWISPKPTAADMIGHFDEKK